MRKIIILLITTVLSVQLYGQRQLTANQQAVQQTVIKLFNALSSRDSISLKAACTSDLTLYEYGQVWNIDTLILKAITLNPSSDFERTNSFDFINTTLDKTMAWVTYRLQSSITRDGKQTTMQWLETVVLVKERKLWKIKHLHSTRIKRS
ncbi:MAG: nuclear transport factor 2 family protein [Cyclobacteriaceae bacterium]|nr:nuclear transport factor 2 family protein [Cyclobacteriaceae bacterium]